MVARKLLTMVEYVCKYFILDFIVEKCSNWYRYDTIA